MGRFFWKWASAHTCFIYLYHLEARGSTEISYIQMGDSLIFNLQTSKWNLPNLPVHRHQPDQVRLQLRFQRPLPLGQLINEAFSLGTECVSRKVSGFLWLPYQLPDSWWCLSQQISQRSPKTVIASWWPHSLVHCEGFCKNSSKEARMKTLRVVFQSIECPSTIHSVSFNTSATSSMPKSSILSSNESSVPAFLAAFGSIVWAHRTPSYVEAPWTVYVWMCAWFFQLAGCFWVFLSWTQLWALVEMIYIHKLVSQSHRETKWPKKLLAECYTVTTCAVLLLSHLFMKLGFATALCKDKSAKVQVSFDSL